MKGSRSESGLALVVALLMMVALLLIGTGLAVSSRGGVSVSTSFRNQQTAFEAALAGLEHGREAVRARQFTYSQPPPPTPVPGDADRFTALLTLAADGAGLTNSVDLANFNVSGTTTTGFTGTPDRPVLANSGTPIVSGGIVSIGGAAYRTFVTNDAAEGASTVADSNRAITLTAFGSDAASRGYSVVQAVFEPRQVPPITMDPGLVMPGPTINFGAPNSNASDFSGDGGSACYPSIGVTTNQAAIDAVNAIPSARRDNYVTCDPGGGSDLDAESVPHPSVENVLRNTATLRNPYNNAGPPLPDHTPYLEQPCPVGSTDPRCSDPHYITSVAYYTNIRATYEGFADYLIGPAGGGGTSTITLDGSSLGTVGAPRITVASGSDITVQPGDYGGVLVITLNSSTNHVTFHGNFSFTGSLYILGNARVRRTGGGSGVYCGGVIIANTADTVLDANDGTTLRVGAPTLDVNGGGTHFNGPASSSPSGVTNCTTATDPNYIRWGNPLNRVSFQQLR